MIELKRGDGGAAPAGGSVTALNLTGRVPILP
jgi:hypothetical protein